METPTTAPTAQNPTTDQCPWSEQPVPFGYEVLGHVLNAFDELDSYQAPAEHAAFLQALATARAAYLGGMDTNDAGKTPLIVLALAAEEQARRMYIDGFEAGIAIEGMRRAMVGPTRLCPACGGQGRDEGAACRRCTGKGYVHVANTLRD